ncbi:MAG TPA: hypothetical protein VKV05_02090 [Terriglobales bacterium]|nr:hypothetical protein [Terriglobales bacterium]
MKQTQVGIEAIDGMGLKRRQAKGSSSADGGRQGARKTLDFIRFAAHVSGLCPILSFYELIAIQYRQLFALIKGRTR